MSDDLPAFMMPAALSLTLPVEALVLDVRHEFIMLVALLDERADTPL